MRHAHCIAALLPLTLASLSGGIIAAEEPLSITHGPYLQQPDQTSMTVVWFTNRPCVSKLEYGTGDKPDRVAVGARYGLIDAFSTTHAVRLTGLVPGTTYRYRVSSTEIVKMEAYKVTYGRSVSSDIHAFTTLNAGKPSFSFLAVNDIHNQDRRLSSMFQTVAWKDVDLVFLNGDMVGHIDAISQLFSGFLDVCVNTFATRIPPILVRGNHETRGPAARQLMEVFPNSDNRFYRSFDHGGVHFIVLDSGEDKPDSNKEYYGLAAFDAYRIEQAQWLAADAQSPSFKQAKFRIAFFHMPPYGGNNWHGETHLRTLWSPIFNQSGVDLVICGHTHAFAHIPPRESANNYPIIIGSTDTVIRGDVAGPRLTITVTAPNKQVLKTLSIDAR